VTPTAVTAAVAFFSCGQQALEEKLSRIFPQPAFSAPGSGVCRIPHLRFEKA